VIVAVNTPAVQAAKKATRTVPIIMMRVADPVKSGLVASLRRPGGNATGLSFMPDALGPKGVELLHEVLPNVKRMAALYQGNNPGAIVIVDEVVTKGEQLGLNFARVPVHGPKEYANAFEIATTAKSEALFVMDDERLRATARKFLSSRPGARSPSYRSTRTSQGPAALSPTARTWTLFIDVLRISSISS
jgi:ABC-type uncharacterized transport system substrate-binding protein